jgi:hypothetical protein
MRAKILAAAFVAALGAMPFASVQAAECIVVGHRATFGSNSTGNFEVSSGQSCHYAFDLRGAVASSKIATPARHGTVRMIDLSSFEYKPNAGFTGSDSFAIEATGESQTGKGRSVLTMNVRVK